MPRTKRPNPLHVTDGFRAFVLDQLDGVGGVVARPMFGGVGLYRGGLFFGILAGDVLYLKVDDRTRPEYESAGMPPFKPYAHRPVTMQYYAVPIGVLESAEELVSWAHKAVAAAARAAARSRRPRADIVRSKPRRRR